MTQEEKELLLKDLCARLPYDVIVKISHRVVDGKTGKVIKEECHDKTLSLWNEDLLHKAISNIKPYLRSMSSMTEEEREHLQTLHDIISDENYGDGFSPAAWEAILDFNNYCREHHLDNGGLITLGLALEAPAGMYK